MVLKRVVKLNTGAEMPVLGFGASLIFFGRYRYLCVTKEALANLICMGD